MVVAATGEYMAVSELVSGMANTELRWLLKRCQCSQGSVKINVRYFRISSHPIILILIPLMPSLGRSEVESVMSGWKIAAMVLVKVAGLQVAVVG